jgi:hypothetical protein
MDQERQPGDPPGDPLNVLILYDQRSVFTNTVREHLDSFARFSRHRFAYAHAAADGPLTFSLDRFDVVILHYSIRLAFDWHLSPEFAWALRSFRGLKALFIQDEYDHTWTACRWIEQLGVSLVFTCVPLEHVRDIYSKVDHRRVTFVPTLTGYLPIDAELERHVKPLPERPVVIGYRGRALPFRYGRLGQEKLTIGVRMKHVCRDRNIPHDIEWTEDKRIYGDAWVDFVASCRATLGTESGSNVFDFDGSLTVQVNAALAANPKVTYEEIEGRFLAGKELDGVMNQVSPRIFEAVALRTGLILFKGTYSGVVRPDEHFIPLKKDFSNVDEVLRRVRDDSELSAMTDRAYRHVIQSGTYTYPAFIRSVDAILDRHATAGRADVLPRNDAGFTTQVGAAIVEPPRPKGLLGLARLPFRAARFAYRRLGLFRIKEKVRKARKGYRLIMSDPVLAETWTAVRGTPALKPTGSAYQWFKELLRLSLLRYCCQTGPTVHTPAWITVAFDPATARVTFTSHPVSTMGSGIRSGDPDLATSVEAIRARVAKEIVWDFSTVNADVRPNPDRLPKPDYYFLGNGGSFRFTAMERLADLEPELAARALAHVATGVYALGAVAPVGREPAVAYRRAS